MRIAQLQTMVYDSKEKNREEIDRIFRMLYETTKDDGGMPDMVLLGEMCVCPYENAAFPKYAEKEQGETWRFFQALAKEYGVYLSAGSVPEKDDAGNIYNTAYVFDRNGNQIAKHRKVHMFDIDIEGGQHFRESDTLTPGDRFDVFDTEFGRMGICICFDARFPEGIRLQVLKGAKVILCPANFNMTTGPAHWELMFRSRAVDNQCYVIGTGAARDENGSYVAYGHSLVVSPWGEILTEADEKPVVQITEIDLKTVDKIRAELPLLSARREDVYILTQTEREP